MSEQIIYRVEDFSNLPFDVSRHAEALVSFATLHLLPQSIVPALCARDLVFIRVPSCTFRIGITRHPERQETIERNNGSIAFEIIYQADDSTDAWQVRDEVERYFRRHYPGRTMSTMTETSEEMIMSNTVYVTCYAPED